jgi:hypothetical protein
MLISFDTLANEHPADSADGIFRHICGDDENICKGRAAA